MFKPVEPKPDFSKLEEKILKFWKEKKIFEKSVERRPKDKIYSFYDGPPFITGLPHYGSLLSSIAKDVIPRYQTMKGKRVRRVWGWDCHGLPAENEVETLLGLKSKRDIEKLGVGKFVEACRKFVSKTSAEWEWYVDHVGRWVDFKNAYKTMDLSYMETVLWVFKSLYDKGLIYKGKRVSLFCPRCSTPLSKFEITMDEGSYRDIQDPAITIKFKVKNKNQYILAWTTTPWTLPANFALAVDPKQDYLEVEKDGEKFILAKKRFDAFFDKKTKIIRKFKGSELVGLSFEPLYSFFKGGKNDHQVYPADFVSMEEGTGVVHIAPGFGEEDTELGNKFGLTMADSVDEEGKLVKKVKPWAGIFIKDADPKIIADLKRRGLLFKEETITHSYPFCYRCQAPLLYKAQEAWYVKVDLLRKKMLKTNEEINWFPKHFKHGRFQYNLEVAPDWCISRTRYWGVPLPVWECECGERYVFGSIKEIEKASGQKLKDLHRPEIDEITIKCKKCTKKAKRVPEVLDCWMESGAMPYGEWHYPFENKEEFKKGFPADFIAEYTGQLRAWFYYLHLLSNALMGSLCFKNVIVTGVIWGSDGKKMSKSLGNYPDPKRILEEHGGDALRLYLMGSQVMAGEDINVSEEGVKSQVRDILIPAWNSFRFFITFARLNQWRPSQSSQKASHVLDRWIESRLWSSTKKFAHHLDSYNVPKSVSQIFEFVNDLSKWYIRRSRDRFRQGDKQALATLYHVLLVFSKRTAPIIPFLSEEIFKNLTDQESVHLEDWPELEKKKIDKSLEEKMVLVRKICELGHAKRKEAKIRVRQPLKSLRVQVSSPKLDNDLLQLIKDELNLKEVVWLKKAVKEPKIELDTQLTPELKAEGEARELVRQIQELRKEKGCRLDEEIVVHLPSWPKEFETYLKKQTLAKKLIKSKQLKIGSQ